VADVESQPEQRRAMQGEAGCRSRGSRLSEHPSSGYTSAVKGLGKRPMLAHARTPKAVAKRHIPCCGQLTKAGKGMRAELADLRGEKQDKLQFERDSKQYGKEAKAELEDRNSKRRRKRRSVCPWLE
jgi:hypothetical protein